MAEEKPEAVEAAPSKASKIPELLTLPSGAKILHTKCKPVGSITPAVKALAQTLEGYLKAHQDDDPRPIGISAPQLGSAVRMSSVILDLEAVPVTYINPELAYEKKLHLVTETCLSLPGRKFLLKRGKVVKIRAMLIDGSMRSIKGRDLNAQLLMHELNHLDGITVDTIGERIT